MNVIQHYYSAWKILPADNDSNRKCMMLTVDRQTATQFTIQQLKSSLQIIFFLTANNTINDLIITKSHCSYYKQFPSVL